MMTPRARTPPNVRIVSREVPIGSPFWKSCRTELFARPQLDSAILSGVSSELWLRIASEDLFAALIELVGSFNNVPLTGDSSCHLRKSLRIWLSTPDDPLPRSCAGATPVDRDKAVKTATAAVEIRFILFFLEAALKL